ncbi:hypothetical protein HOL21_03490 [Candidatus Woesearchaeota archaeon]|nr:hypothetical protein [Candidatus Woesearchaeota archaeon]MBT5397250.1 hypothetical protein [Candidatus Woesearchaeota archaeon]MBT6367204.1 hypothetical protein [Candidatus Woesearchaeota archaeon]MBT7762650.1 hypothetical protein [Candidatus Woesearchaeota archaeon]
MEYKDVLRLGLEPTEIVEVTKTYKRDDKQDALDTRTLYFVGLIPVSDEAPNGKLKFCTTYHSEPINGEKPHRMKRKLFPVRPESVDIGDLVLIERPNGLF